MALLFLPAPTQLEFLSSRRDIGSSSAKRCGRRQSCESLKNRHRADPAWSSSAATEWVVQECSGLYGGIFVSSAQAMKYAFSENGRHRESIGLTEEIVELDTARRPAAQRPETSPSDAVRKHAA